MKRLAAVLLGLASISAAAPASDYDLFIYDEFASVLYDGSEGVGIVTEQVLYWNQNAFEETVLISVKQDPSDPDVAGLGFYVEIWIDGALTYQDQGVGDVDYYQAVPSGSTVEAYMWPVSEWTVSTVDWGNDFADGVWDGFAVTIEVNGTTIYDESNYGEVVYPFEVLYGDQIDVWLWSTWDDYDLELYDGYGGLVDYSYLAPIDEPDWILATVGGTSSGGRELWGGGDAVVILCGAVRGGGGPLGLVFPALVGLFALATFGGRRALRICRGRPGP